MLSPNSTPLEVATPQTGMRLNSMDVAVCLNHLRPECRAAALAYALEDYSGMPLLERKVANRVIREHPASYKTSYAIACIPKLTKLYVASLNPERRCFECKGKGMVFRTDYEDQGEEHYYQQKCIPCSGKGKITLNQTVMAKYFGVAPSTWSEVWSDRFQQVGHVIDEWLQEAEQQLQRLING